MNEIQFFDNTEVEKEIIEVSNALHQRFNARFIWFNTPITIEETSRNFTTLQTKKVLTIASDQLYT